MPRDLLRRRPAGGLSLVYDQQFLPGIDNLSQDMPLPSGDLAPNALIVGKNASTTGWTATVGEDLEVVSGSGAVRPNLYTPFGYSDRSVGLEAGGDYFATPGPTSMGDIPDGHDGIIEVAWRHFSESNASGNILFHGDYNTEGWLLYWSNVSGLPLSLWIGGQFYPMFVEKTFNSWNHVIVAIRSDGNQRHWVNGGAVGNISKTFSRPTGSNSKFQVGSPDSFQDTLDIELAYAAVYDGGGVLPADLSTLDDAMQERFAALWGLDPSVARGSKSFTFNRNSAAHTDRLVFGQVTKYHLINWDTPRIAERRDETSSYSDANVVSNGFPYSEDLTKSNWVKTNLTLGTPLTVGEGDETLTLQAFVPDAVDDVHVIADELSPASVDTHIFSCYAKAGDKTVLHLGSEHPGLGQDVGIFVDLATQQTATYGGIFYTAYVEDASAAFGAGVYRVGFSYSGPGSNHAHEISWATGIPASPAGNSSELTYLGDGVTVDGYVGGCMHDFGVDNLDDYVYTNGAARTLGRKIRGYLSEATKANECLQSSDLSTTWAKTNAGDTVSADSIIADSTNTQHGVTQAITLTAEEHTLSVRLKSGTGWAYLAVDTLTDVDAYIDTDTGEVGTAGANATARVGDIDWEGYRRAELVFTATAASHTVRVAAAEADGDDVFAGDGATVSLLAKNVQVEAASFASTIIDTAASAAVRDDDDFYTVALENIGGENPSEFSAAVEFLVESSVPAGDAGILFDITDGGGLAERIVPYLNSGKVRVNTVASAGAGGDVQGSNDLTDGIAHSIVMTLAPNDLEVFDDGSSVGTDTSAAMPVGLDRVNIGERQNFTGQLEGIVSRIRFYRKSLATPPKASWE